jgi:2,3-bisphosphoglycerate-independent phosphoglycerate mutase
MRVLFLFLDGVGLGENDSEINPFVNGDLPILENLLAGNKLLMETISPNSPALKGLVTERATLIALDAGLGVEGLPQSATGQAALLTGINVPSEIGYHYGPKPNKEVAAYLRNGNIFCTLSDQGYKSALLNAYPPGYFSAIKSGRRLYSAIPLAVTSAGIPLKTLEDLVKGQALSADFTAQGWRERLDLPDTPVMTPSQAGAKLAELSEEYHLAFFEYWLSDYAGHGQDMQGAMSLLSTFDQMLDGLLEKWDDEKGLILITSDHGNMEDLSTRRHTANPVPALVVGDLNLRREFVEGMRDITGIAPAILKLVHQGNGLSLSQGK